MAGPSIDVGIAGDMSGTTRNWTLVNKVNPANATGLVTLVNLWAAGVCTNVHIGSFIAVGDVLSTRGYTSLPNLAAGDNEFSADNGDFTPFEIRAGDYIGGYVESSISGLDANATGGGGVWASNALQMPCTDVTFDSGGPYPGTEVSVYAAGFQLGHINIGDAWKVIQNIQINVGDAWKQITLGSKINISDVWKDILH